MIPIKTHIKIYRKSSARTLLIGLLAGCVQKDIGDLTTLVIGIENEVKNLDRRSNAEANATQIGHLFSQTLVKVGPTLLPVPDLAQSFEIQNGRIYRFHLAADLSFHDGHPLRCSDVEFNFRQAAERASNLQSGFANVADMRCESPQDFVVTLKKARASFLLSEVAELHIYPPHFSEDPRFATQPIGSGPYRFKERRSRDLIFERFDNYQRYANGKRLPLPFFKRVIVRSIQDPTTRFLSLMGGDIDLLINALSPRRVLEAEANPYLKVLRSPGTTYQYVGINLRLPKFRDLRVRRALAMALNRNEIIQHKLLGFAQLADSVLSPSNFFHDKQIEPMAYDPSAARALLKAAGASDLSVELKVSTDRDINSIALILKEHWEKIGIRVTLRPYEFATFFSDIRNGNFELFSLRWTSVADPGLLSQIFHSRELPPGRNRVAYQNPAVDRLLDQAQMETHLERRRQTYAEVQRLIARDIPYISLWYPDNIAVVSRSLRNFTLHPTGQWLTFLDAQKVESP